MSPTRQCAMCKNVATRYIMGPFPGDWGDYYCEDHPTNPDPGSIVEPYQQKET